MNPKELSEALLQALSQNLLHLIFQFVVVGVTLMLLKNFIESLAGFVMFRIDSHTSIGSPVEVYGKRGRIKEASIFDITVETECGFIRIPSRSWRSARVINLKDEVFLRDRRECDKKLKT